MGATVGTTSAAVGAGGNDLRQKLAARKALNVGGVGGEGGSRRREGGLRPHGFARLDGAKVTKILHCTSLTLGREEPVAAKRKFPDTPADDETAQDEAQLRRDLWRRDRMFLAVGSQPSISRRHADIVYDFRKRRWVLLCLGRNGVFVDSVLVKQGDVPVTLNNKATIEVPNGSPLIFTCPSEQLGGNTVLQRPTESLKVLIAQAMAERPDRSMLVSEIYQRIKDKHAFYRNQPEASWQSSIRHCLTINKCFVKIAAAAGTANAAQKGACWTLVTAGDNALQQLLDSGRPPPPPPLASTAMRAQNPSGNTAGEHGAAGLAAAEGLLQSGLLAKLAGQDGSQMRQVKILWRRVCALVVCVGSVCISLSPSLSRAPLPPLSLLLALSAWPFDFRVLILPARMCRLWKWRKNSLAERFSSVRLLLRLARATPGCRLFLSVLDWRSAVSRRVCPLRWFRRIRIPRPQELELR